MEKVVIIVSHSIIIIIMLVKLLFQHADIMTNNFHIFQDEESELNEQIGSHHMYTPYTIIILT